MHWSLTVLALILLYGGHCFSALKDHKRVSHFASGFPHHVSLATERAGRLGQTSNNAPQHIAIFPGAIIAA